MTVEELRAKLAQCAPQATVVFLNYSADEELLTDVASDGETVVLT
jgi:hypothetical protein